MCKYIYLGQKKYFLLVHLIFVVKYRKPLVSVFEDRIKKKILEIDTMETDMDHIHLLVSYEPNISVSRIVQLLKQGTTYDLWQLHPNRLKLYFWKKNTFWSPSYFACSVGQASDDVIRRYIQEQG